MTTSKMLRIGFWTATVLFCVEMSFTAYYEVCVLPQAAQAFARLGFPAEFFRVELSVAKIAGVLVLLLPIAPARLKEWAYAGFALNLVSALIAHFCIHDVRAAFVPASVTGVLWMLSYLFWRRLERTQEPARSTQQPDLRSAVAN